MKRRRYITERQLFDFNQDMTSGEKMSKSGFLTLPNSMILLASVIIGILLLGAARLSTLFYVNCMERYNVGRKEASFPFVLCYSVRNIAGPLIGFLGAKFGAEEVTVTGCLLSAIAIGSCFLAEKMITVIILWGLVYGFGFGLGSLLISEILKKYFIQHVDKANGIFIAGESVGALVLSLSCEQLITVYGLSGTFLILSGLILNCIPMAMIFLLYKISNARTHSTGYPETQGIFSLFKYPDKSTSLKSSTTCEKISMNVFTNCDFSSELTLEKKEFESSGDFSDSNENLHLKKITYFHDIIDHSDEYIRRHPTRVEDPKSNIERKSALQSFAVFVNPVFICIAIFQSLSVFISTSLYVVMIDYSRDMGVEHHQEKYMYMATIFCDSLGRIFLGGITDGGHMTKVNFAATCFTLLGTLFVLFSWISAVVLVFLTMCMATFLIGGLLLIGPGITIEYIGENDLSMALASRLLLVGPFNIVLPQLIGYFRETHKSYRGLFFSLAAINILGAFLCVITPVIKKRRTKQKAFKQSLQPINPL